MRVFFFCFVLLTASFLFTSTSTAMAAPAYSNSTAENGAADNGTAESFTPDSATPESGTSNGTVSAFVAEPSTPLAADFGADNATLSEEGRLPQPAFKADASYDFRNVRWGMSIDEVKAQEGGTVTKAAEDIKNNIYRIGYKDEDLLGIKVWLLYSFSDGKCWGAAYSRDYLESGEYEKILAELTKYYGTPEPFVTEGQDKAVTSIWTDGDTLISLTYAAGTYKGDRMNLIFISNKLAPDFYKRTKK